MIRERLARFKRLSKRARRVQKIIPAAPMTTKPSSAPRHAHVVKAEAPASPLKTRAQHRRAAAATKARRALAVVRDN